VKAIFPASTSSLSFAMCSFTHGFRFGLLRSAIRKVGCLPTPFGTKGCAGSWFTGGTSFGTASKKGPLPLRATQPTLFEEKSGMTFSCAAAGMIGAVHDPNRMPPASSFSPKVIKVLAISPVAISSRGRNISAIGQISLRLSARRKPYMFRALRARKRVVERWTPHRSRRALPTRLRAQPKWYALYQSPRCVADGRPVASGDGHDFPRLADKCVPRVAAVIDDVVE
jgi:hypothetical protein